MKNIGEKRRSLEQVSLSLLSPLSRSRSISKHRRLRFISVCVCVCVLHYVKFLVSGFSGQVVASGSLSSRFSSISYQMATKINQKEYLKKYLSGDVGSEKKKKKKKRAIVGQTVKIIDDDVDVSKMQHLQDNDLEMLTTGEDAPQVVGVIDERPPELRAQDFKNSTKWKVISDDNGYESSLTVQQLDRKSGRIEKSHTSKHSASRKRNISPDLSPVRKQKSPDLSPVRRNRSPDLSPKRRKSPGRHSDDLSPPRRRRREYSRSPERSRKRRSPDLSPPRKRRSPGPSTSRKRQSPDLSPKRRRQTPDFSPKRRRDYSPASPEKTKMRKTLEGKTAGLQDAKSLRVESNKIRKRDAEAFSKMSDEMSGRNATLVLRDKRTGRIRDLEQEAEKERAKERKEQEKKAVYDRWGKGLKQVEDYRQKMDDESHEMSKPLARYSDDADLDRYLKGQEREGDPMLEYIRQKEREKQKESKAPAMPIYRGPYPPNRLGIRPGYRWDGVDRSNGYEKKWFDMQNKKKAIQEEAYRYSTEDL